MTARGLWRQVILLAMLVASCAVPAFAASAMREKTLGTFGAWRAYTYNEGGQTVCYMVTTKVVTSTGPKKRATPYLMITHRPIEASTDVVSFGAGMRIDSKHGVAIHIGKSLFELFSVHDTAWARDARTDHKLAAAIKNTPTARIISFPEKKDTKEVVDQFDLSGSPAAYHAIGKACGLPDEMPRKPKPAAPLRAKHS
ncbi:MAG: invasion associated locus B family protein [Alphaproteobacteria bacterium]